MIHTTLNSIRKHNPCANGWAKLLAYLSKTGPDDEPLPLVTILDSNGLNDAMWALRAVTGEDARIRRYGVWCARQVQHLMTDHRSVNALDVAERHADGLATDDELRVAWAAAGAAVRNAAWDAAGAAAWDAAWAAARVAVRDAVRDAAWAAARVAAGSAAGAAARDAAGAAAGDAMRERQAARFREVFGKQEVGRE